MAPRAQLAFFVLVSLLLSCNGKGNKECEEACERGFACNTEIGACEPTQLATREGELPGRAVRVATGGGHVYLTMLDPATHEVLVASYEDLEQAPDVRVVHDLRRATSSRLALASSPRRVAVAWLAEDGRYEIAYRFHQASNAIWSYAVVELEDGSYRGSGDFDLSFDARERVHLVFRDRENRMLRHVRADALDGAWEIETIDDGRAIEGASSCAKASEGDMTSPEGPGVEPDLAVRDDSLYVSYHDPVCGQLRLARRTDTWGVSVVDPGDIDTEGSTRAGSVGRFSSIAFDPAGRPAIAYQDSARGRLLFARDDEGRFRVEVVDDGLTIDEFSRHRKTLVGAFASLSFDEQGQPAITYLDQSLVDLRIARRDESGAWLRRSLVSQGFVGTFAHHVHDASRGRIVVAERLVPGEEDLASTLVLLGEID